VLDEEAPATDGIDVDTHVRGAEGLGDGSGDCGQLLVRAVRALQPLRQSGPTTFISAGHLLLGYTTLGLVLVARPELTVAAE
jgi:hypothetical protein